MISDGYRAILQETHAKDPSWGTSALRWQGMVRDVADRYGCKSILDYGCGKGELSRRMFGIVNYDPATFPDRPAACDMTACIDVLEHVEPEHLDAMLEDLRALTREAAFVVISLEPALTILPDGRNAHLIVETGDWWRERLFKFFDLADWQEHAGEVVAVLVPKPGVSE